MPRDQELSGKDPFAGGRTGETSGRRRGDCAGKRVDLQRYARVSLIVFQDRLLLLEHPFDLFGDILKVPHHPPVGFERKRIPPEAGFAVHAFWRGKQCPVQGVHILEYFRDLVVLHQESDQLYVEVYGPFFVLSAKGPEIFVLGFQHGAGIGFEALIVDGDQLIHVLNKGRIG
jgi:hypothetical protein